MSAPASSPRLNCPQCRAPIDPRDSLCPACGANIALVTVLAEQQLFERKHSTGPLGTGPLRPFSVEQLVPRLGDYLLAQGYITETQLQAALAQKKESGQGARLIGQILVEMGALSRETLDRVIARQILELQSALLDANRTLEHRVAERTAELEAALFKLTEINQLKANIVSNISHELRTPLTQIKGYTSLMLDGTLGEPDPSQHDALVTVMSAVARLEKMIENLISYASAARGEMTLSFLPVPAAALAESVYERSQSPAYKKGVGLQLRCAPDLPAVQGDEEKLRWVLMQLIDNAIKFTPAGGQVTFSLGLDKGLVRFAVQDTGIGIPAGRLGELFEDFRQLDSSATRRYGGAGLGLALVRRIVEAHGARIMVDSRVDRGSVFAFALPPAEHHPDRGAHA
ncbi:MAG: hypothetical protein KA764_05605 [Anaerolineales bacterium]|nr:hypothetical protein [Anaerolineales bacterium]